MFSKKRDFFGFIIDHNFGLADLSKWWRGWVGGGITFPIILKTNHWRNLMGLWLVIWQGVWYIYIRSGCDRDRVPQWTEDLRRIGGFPPGGGHPPIIRHTPETFIKQIYIWTFRPLEDLRSRRLPRSLYEVAWRPLPYKHLRSETFIKPKVYELSSTEF